MKKPMSSRLVDLVRLSQAPGQARLELELIESALDYIPDLVLILDKTSVICVANLAFCNKFGFQRDQITGRDARELFPPDAGQTFSLQPPLLPASACFLRENLSVLNGAGKSCLLDCIKVPLLDKHNGLQGIFFIGRDITKQANQERERESLISSLKDTLNMLGKQSRVLKQMNRELEGLATTDALTQVNNRRFFDQKISVEWRRCHREHSPLALMMIDIDYFKLYNDHYGHTMGDTCLTKVAQVLRQVTCRRPGDIFARFGGEEFVALLPNTVRGLTALAKRSVDSVSALAIEHVKSEVPGRVVTISIGAVVGYPHLLDSSLDLLDLADQQLYLAKQKGRNTCEYSGVSSKDDI